MGPPPVDQLPGGWPKHNEDHPLPRRAVILVVSACKYGLWNWYWLAICSSTSTNSGAGAERLLWQHTDRARSRINGAPLQPQLEAGRPTASCPSSNHINTLLNLEPSPHSSTSTKRLLPLGSGTALPATTTSRHRPRASAAVPAGSYLTMSGRFSYHKLKKLPSDAATTTLHQEQDQQEQQQQQPPAASIQDYYHSYYRALGAAVARGRRARQWPSGGRRRRRPRLRVSSLARALRRKAAAVGGNVKASVAKVAKRLMEGRPYIGDLFAGNYMFMQVAPSPTMTGFDDKGFLPFTEYYYGKAKNKPAAPGALRLHPAAAGPLDKV
ncbi:uncharacterized protein LOC133908321 [Phragmites australis]|uniref:uncharacterized protein LOC133908321 n=1 Tax=Phragmites australis TaxID=29695 RepID=UPI002D78E234|nr:uncharacterized protein LOC133908321 [Phragmites australis]